MGVWQVGIKEQELTELRCAMSSWMSPAGSRPTPSQGPPSASRAPGALSEEWQEQASTPARRRQLARGAADEEEDMRVDREETAEAAEAEISKLLTQVTAVSAERDIALAELQTTVSAVRETGSVGSEEVESLQGQLASARVRETALAERVRDLEEQVRWRARRPLPVGGWGGMQRVRLRV